MRWGRLDDPDWWWEHALDGVMGGVLAGLVTALAVWLTLRHERKLVAEAVERERGDADLASARAQALACQSAIWQLVGSQAAQMDVGAFREKLFTLLAVVNKRWPNFCAKVLDSGKIVADEASKKRLGDSDGSALSSVGGDLVGAIGAWIRDPQTFDKPVKTPPPRATPRRLR